MTAAADFIVATLQNEGDEYRAADARERLGSDLRFYGASVGAVRGTVRDALRRQPPLTHDEVTALASELWDVPVFERRLAAVVMLQANVRLLIHSDLTRIEGFLRDGRVIELVDPLVADVVRPLLANLDESARVKAQVVVARWKSDRNEWLRRASANLAKG
ncbi:MAG: alkylation repair protein [Glaciihabitans sp.]|nr:alkylation repair protein [Glaciihabitans sp.]